MRTPLRELSSRCCATLPLLLPAIGFVIGMVVAMRVGDRGVWLGAAVGTLMLWPLAEWRRMHAIAAGLVFVAVTASGGVLWLNNQAYVEADHIARVVPDDSPLPITARLTVLSVERGGAPDAKRPEGVHATVAVDAALTQAGWREVAGTATLRINQGRPLRRGDRIEVYGWARRPSGPQNPGEFDYRRYLASSRIFVTLEANRAGQVIDLSHEESWSPGQSLTTARTFLRGKLLEHTADVDAQSANTIVALLLGYRDPSINDVAQDFTRAGIAHLLAISGSHIALFALLVWGVLKLFMLRPRMRALLTMGAVLAYVLATPCGPPVVRAGIGAIFVLTAVLLGHQRSTINTLAAALVAVLIYRPADLLDPGLQLSFVSTAGLVLLAARMHAWLHFRFIVRQLEIWRVIDSRASRIKAWLLNALLLAVTANAIGTITAAPLVLLHFSQFNTWSILTGLVALPVVTVVMVCALVQLLIELLAPGVGALTAPFVVWLGALMNGLVRLLAELPGAAVALRAPPALLVVLTFVVFTLWVLRRQLALPRAHIAVLGMAAVALFAVFTWPLPPREVQVRALAVGRGSAVILHTPEGRSYVINAGAELSPQTATRIVEPALRHDGINRLDGMIVTAGDRHHAGDADEILSLLPADRVICSAVTHSQRDWSLAATQLFDTAAGQRVPVATLSAGDQLALDAHTTLRVLWPPREAQLAAAAPWRSNLIALIETRQSRLLVAHPRQDVLLSRMDLPPIDAICFTDARDESPHMRELLARLKPRYVVWSDAKQRRRLTPPQLPAGESITGESGAAIIRLAP